jgi:hypothetical protein
MFERNHEKMFCKGIYLRWFLLNTLADPISWFVRKQHFCRPLSVTRSIWLTERPFNSRKPSEQRPWGYCFCFHWGWPQVLFQGDWCLHRHKIYPLLLKDHGPHQKISNFALKGCCSTEMEQLAGSDQKKYRFLINQLIWQANVLNKN